MPETPLSDRRAALFRHVSAEKRAEYRAAMEAFAAAKRQFRLHLRPDEVHAEARWPAAAPPSPEAVQELLAQLVEWGNLEAQPDTSRVATLEDFYRARFLYRLSEGGEAVEASLETFLRAIGRRAELQTVALIDIHDRLESLLLLAEADPLDDAKVHGVLRDLVTIFASLADNAQAFMTSLARSIEVQRGDDAAVMTYKRRLIEYLERFIGDLVTYSGRIEHSVRRLMPRVEPLIEAVATRDARDSMPDDGADMRRVHAERVRAWRERWAGLEAWFVPGHHAPSQAEVLRSRARAAIPQLLSAVAALNERRSGRSDRSADFRTLARWFAEAESVRDAHRLWRAAFGLAPARHLSLVPPGDEISAATPWSEAPAIEVHPRLRERGRIAPRGAPPKLRDRSADRARLARELAREEEIRMLARRRLATGEPIRLSDFGRLSDAEFRLLLALLGEALAEQTDPGVAVERVSTDGGLTIRLEPLIDDAALASIETDAGWFGGADHVLTVTPREAAE